MEITQPRNSSMVCLEDDIMAFEKDDQNIGNSRAKRSAGQIDLNDIRNIVVRSFPGSVIRNIGILRAQKRQEYPSQMLRGWFI